jgi:aspartyl-tRNA(Asn)/glutamyl-tRNA(Gln) amidotransferase subunit A
VISNCEGAQLHLEHLRHRFADMEPHSRDPGSWPAPCCRRPGSLKAQQFRRWFHDEMLAVFSQVDVILAPATPRSAPLIGEDTFDLNGTTQLTRPAMGLVTQPISFVGLPVAVAPIPRADGALPIGIQVIAPPWREDLCLRVAQSLSDAGVAAAPIAPGFGPHALP